MSLLKLESKSSCSYSKPEKRQKVKGSGINMMLWLSSFLRQCMSLRTRSIQLSYDKTASSHLKNQTDFSNKVKCSSLQTTVNSVIFTCTFSKFEHKYKNEI